MIQTIATITILIDDLNITQEDLFCYTVPMANTDNTSALTGYDEIIQGLEIFKKYPGHPHYVTAEHDMLFAGPRPSKVSEEDLAKLTSLGWNPEDYDDCFIKFV